MDGDSSSQEGGNAPLGLSTAHITAQSVTPRRHRFGAAKGIVRVDFYPGLVHSRTEVSGLPEYLERSDRPKPDGFGTTRGTVRGFSKASRRRLLRLLAKVDRTQVPLMITMTYPGSYDEDSRAWKSDLDNFYRRFHRQFPGAASIWKLEFQKRGAPHYHLLVWGLQEARLGAGVRHEVQRWLSTAWYEVVCSGDERHLRAGTRIEVIRDWRGASAYAAKYLGKVDDTGHLPCGRVWGVRKPKNLPFGPVQSVRLTVLQAFRLARWLRRMVKHEGVKMQLRKTLSFQVFGRGSDWLHAAQTLSTMSDNIYYVSFPNAHQFVQTILMPIVENEINSPGRQRWCPEFSICAVTSPSPTVL